MAIEYRVIPRKILAGKYLCSHWQQKSCTIKSGFVYNKI